MTDTMFTRERLAKVTHINLSNQDEKTYLMKIACKHRLCICHQN